MTFSICLFTFLAFAVVLSLVRQRQLAVRQLVDAATAMRDAPFYDMTGGTRYRALGRAVDIIHHRSPR